MRSGAGFAYLGLLILLAIMGVVGAAALQLGKVTHRRAAEEALLDVGSEFGQALENYRRASPAGRPDAPLELQELLKDPRSPGTLRHLRKLYADPLTGKQEWGTLRSPDSNRILGVYSLSDARPIKIANFDPQFQDFAGKSSYRQWVFTRGQGGAAVAAGGAAGSASSGGTLITPMELADPAEAAPAAAHPAETSPPAAASGSPSGLVSPRDLQ
jgi:type II secretory pathway pseudopilin PulG